MMKFVLNFMCSPPSRLTTRFVRPASTDISSSNIDLNYQSPTTLKNRMKAWQIHAYGDIKELQLSTSRIPIISSSSELLVKVFGASLNPIDYMMMSGYAKSVASFFRQYDLEFPLTLGRDFSGVVVDKGQDVGDFKIGDPVYGVIPFHKQGSLAEAVIADKSLICKKPERLSHTESASLLYAGLTAWSALYITGELCLYDAKKTRVLILGASGGVGTLAVQMLKSQGATVIGTCSTNAVQMVQSLGVDAVHDYSDVNYTKNVGDFGPYDVVLDCANVGSENIPSVWTYNKYITLNSPLVKNTDKHGILGGFAVSARDLLLENIPKCASGKSIRWGFFYPFTNGIQFIDQLVKEEKINPVIHRSFKFSNVPEAFETLQGGHLRGKIVIDMK